jgi:hypothetical protein
LESDALHTAAATLPCAIAVNAIEDCTVEGRAHRNSTPSINSGPIQREESTSLRTGAEQGEKDKRDCQHEQVKAPVGEPGDDGLAREAGAVQEKQKGDGQRGNRVQGFGHLAAGRQRHRQGDGCEHDEQEAVVNDGQAGHGRTFECSRLFCGIPALHARKPLAGAAQDCRKHPFSDISRAPISDPKQP